MKCKKTSSAKAVFGFFNAVFFVLGFVQVTFGFLLLCDNERVLLSRLLAAPDSGLAQPPFYYVGLAVLGSGLAICAIAAMGCWATYMPGYVILTIYFLLVLSLLIGACAGGVLAAVWTQCVGVAGAAGGAVGTLQAYYALPQYEDFTAAVDLAQTKLECCGMVSASNYDMSLWQLRRLGPLGMTVPPSCCVQTPQGSYLNPVPLNQTRCQERSADPMFRHVPGCLNKLEDWYQQHYLILMMALFVSALIKLGILLSTIFSCMRLRRRRTDQHFFMKTIDNKMNENIYESKMGTIHDEPIMAKYIQPNNYYSPRVRNPRIFPSKPNEMV